MPRSRAGLFTLACAGALGCTQDSAPTQKTSPASAPATQPAAAEHSDTPAPTPQPAPAFAPQAKLLADVLAVEADGSEGAYTFAVTLRSPDEGCEHYANWWEVLRPDGSLVYRRILGHSHVDEQPFTRRGGPVKVGRDDVLVVRAHLHPDGYGGVALQGSVSTGFEPKSSIDASWASKVESQEPLPERCAF